MRIIFILVLLVVTVAGTASAGLIDVNTGFGVIRDSEGNIIAKSELPVGKHMIDDDCTYEEVADKEALNSVVVYNEQDSLLLKEIEIEEEIREIVIREIKKTKPDFEDPRKSSNGNNR